MSSVLGLDIGGANLKAAHGTGIAHTRPFPLWKQPLGLADQLRDIRAQMPPHDVLAVTMTGELCDCFASKREGVLAILGSVVDAADGTPVRVWTTRGEFVESARVRDDPLPAAAANWLALAYLAGRFTEGEPSLLIDAGSTTTDFVYLEQGKPRPRYFTDRERMAGGELVYTGVRRTPVCAVLGMGVAAEFFATMLDVYLVLGLVPENDGDTDTADGRPATRLLARARLARMLCADVEDLAAGEIEALARRALDAQIGHVGCAIDRVLDGVRPPRRVILSGSGEVLGRQVIARHTALAGVPVVSLAERLGPSLSEAAGAYAVAMLAAEGMDGQLPRSGETG
jgi:probable H4MPT-linked C1 transfer pathway protein